jgi:[ribosomal protein S5]-alanine N-acetyltransferase
MPREYWEVDLPEPSALKSEETLDAPIELRSERLRLRELEPRDLEPLMGFWAEEKSQPDILTLQRNPEVVRASLEFQLKRARRMHRTTINLAVERCADNQLIGEISVRELRLGSRALFIGWHYSREFAGQGYATEAARLLLNYAFEEYDIKEYFADCFINNHATIRVLQKLGMRQRFLHSLWDRFLPALYGEDALITRFCSTKRPALK